MDNEEIGLIQLHKTLDRKYGYNVATGGSVSKIMPKETRLKIAKALTGRVVSQETCTKISLAKKGVSRNMSEEERKKLSAKMSGSNNPMYGTKRPDRALLNKNNLGSKVTDETKNKISNGLKAFL